LDRSSRRIRLFRWDRNQRADRSSIFDQILPRDSLDVFGRDSSDPIEKLVDPAPARSDGLSLTEQHRVTEVGILFEDSSRFDLVLGPLEFLF
jgi:hypothetical protein